jgi:hypothetical protein
MTTTNSYFRAFALSCLLALLGGCINEGDVNCGAHLRLEFTYTFNRYFEDRLSEEVRDIQVYIFDRNSGVLVDILQVMSSSINRGYMDIILPRDGEYNFVAWGSSNPVIAQGGYRAVEMINAADHTYREEVRMGETTLDNFRKMLRSTDVRVPFRSDDEQVHGERSPYNVHFDHLFHAITPGVSVSVGRTGGETQVIPLDFMRNTSTLKIEVTGIEHLPQVDTENPLRVFVTARNERYVYNNNIGINARELLYEPPYREITEDQMLIDIKIQRLVIDRHLTAEPVLLHVHHPVTNEPMIAPLNIVEAILAAREAGVPVWATQESIDRELEFPIRISFNHRLGVTISINEWVIVETDAVIN